jgi:Domain of unknown function (DUF4253)
MVTGRLPEEGPVRLGPVTLPAGRPITGDGGQHVAWATVDPVPESGQVWAALSELHPRTGLVPIQLDGLDGDPCIPWDTGAFVRPEDPRQADGLDAATVLGDLWRDWLPPPDEDDPEWAGFRAPFAREFPGLAAPEQVALTPAERRQALDSVLPGIRLEHGATPAARIGLVAAGRPADVPAVLGWNGTYSRWELLLPLTAVLRSWEDRFGARLIDVGYADLRLLADRPPRTLAAAQRIAAEQVGLADECMEVGQTISLIAARLVNAPIWTFWWD